VAKHDPNMLLGPLRLVEYRKHDKTEREESKGAEIIIGNGRFIIIATEIDSDELIRWNGRP